MNKFSVLTMIPFLAATAFASEGGGLRKKRPTSVAQDRRLMFEYNSATQYPSFVMDSASGNVIDILGGSCANGATVGMYPKVGYENQLWEHKFYERNCLWCNGYSSGSISINDVMSDLVDSWWSDALSKQGTLESTYCPNMCLDLDWGNCDAGTKIHLWECHGRSNQRWYFGSNGALHNEACGDSVSAYIDPDTNKLLFGSHVLSRNSKTMKALWEVQPKRVTIRSKAYHTVMDVEGGTATAGSRAIAVDSTISETQKWTVNAIAPSHNEIGKNNFHMAASIKFGSLCLQYAGKTCSPGDGVYLYQTCSEYKYSWIIGPEGKIHPRDCQEHVLAIAADGSIIIAYDENTEAMKWHLDLLPPGQF